MGARFTIVLDTDDPQGLRDAGDRHHSEQEPRHPRWQPCRKGKDRKDRTYQDGREMGQERGRESCHLLFVTPSVSLTESGNFAVTFRDLTI